MDGFANEGYITDIECYKITKWDKIFWLSNPMFLCVLFGLFIYDGLERILEYSKRDDINERRDEQ